MNLRDLDLNLLLVLNALLEKGSVSKAADSLGMSQPAVSNALNRLRKSLGQDLFLRTSRGIVPTRFAENMALPVAQALELIIGAVNNTAEFDPQTSIRDFRVAMTDVCVFHANRAAIPRQSEQAFHAKPSGDSTAKRALQTWRRGVSSFTPSRLRRSNHFGACASIRLIA